MLLDVNDFLRWIHWQNSSDPIGFPSIHTFPPPPQGTKLGGCDSKSLGSTLLESKSRSRTHSPTPIVSDASCFNDTNERNVFILCQIPAQTYPRLIGQFRIFSGESKNWGVLVVGHLILNFETTSQRCPFSTRSESSVNPMKSHWDWRSSGRHFLARGEIVISTRGNGGKSVVEFLLELWPRRRWWCCQTCANSTSVWAFPLEIESVMNGLARASESSSCWFRENLVSQAEQEVQNCCISSGTKPYHRVIIIFCLHDVVTGDRSSAVGVTSLMLDINKVWHSN